MTALPVLEPAPGKLLHLPRNARPTTWDEERREVLESVRRAMRQDAMEPARTAACCFLLQHLAVTGLTPPKRLMSEVRQG